MMDKAKLHKILSQEPKIRQVFDENLREFKNCESWQYEVNGERVGGFDYPFLAEKAGFRAILKAAIDELGYTEHQ